MSGDEQNSSMAIDFTKMDASIKDLLNVLVANHQKEMSAMPKETPKPKTKKKLNVELIRQILKETKEIQQRKNSKKQ